jgi:hypothetical protein
VAGGRHHLRLMRPSLSISFLITLTIVSHATQDLCHAALS